MSTLLKIDGKSFFCACGCNVFQKLQDPTLGELFRCNACNSEYQEA